MGRSAPSGALRAYATPTVVHFSSVLLLAGTLSMPFHTRASVTTCLLIIGFAGIGYVSWISFEARRQDAYSPVRSDWAWHSIIPIVAYGALVVAGAMASGSGSAFLYVSGAATLLLLFIGIHNAWDGAVWMLIARADSDETD